MHWKRLFISAVTAVTITACAPPPSPPDLDTLSNLSDDKALASLGLAGTDLGYHVIDVGTGDVLASRNATRAYPPASTAKVATMVGALGILGPRYRFQTNIWAYGRLKDGTLTGALVLSGNGDPLLGAGDLRGLAVRLRDLGITHVDGDFLYHSDLPTFAAVSSAQPINAPYNQGVSGLNIEFNRAFVAPRRNDDVMTIIPEDARGLTPPLNGTAARQAELPVRDPAALTARLFRTLARQEGLSLPPPEAGNIPKGAVRLAQIYGQPLIEVVRAGLQYSNNMVAEAIGLAASRASGAEIRDLSQSALRLGLWLEREVTDLDRFAPNMTNHSGLDASAKVTPTQMTRILQYAFVRRFDGWRFDALLPPGGGRDGYDGRFRSPETAFRVWAKTGNMLYIKGLAGYLDALSGRRLAFAIYTHDEAQRSKMQAKLEAPSVRAAASDWRRTTGVIEEALIRRWISAY